MKQISIRLAFCLLLSAFSIKAQFDGLSTFFNDTILRKQIISNRISAITEMVTEDSLTKYNGRYCFDTNGRGIEMNMVYGLAQYRNQYEYNASGRWTKTIRYEANDTTKVESWTKYTYDADNRMLKVEKGNNREGKTVVNTLYQSKVIKGKKGTIKMESQRYEDNKLYSTTYSHDSISGKDTFGVYYEFRPGNVDETGRRIGEKTLIRSYTKDHCSYMDEIKYRVFGASETVQKIKTTYTQLDDKGKFLEYGTVLYDETYMDFMQEHPEDFHPNYYSPVFIKALFEGKVQGQKQAENKNTYDANGALIQKETNDYPEDPRAGELITFRYEFKYNEKGQMIEQTMQGVEGYNSLQVFWYNKNGMIYKTLLTYWNTSEENPVKKTKTMEYVYTTY